MMKEMGFNLLRKREVEKSDTDESSEGEGVMRLIEVAGPRLVVVDATNEIVTSRHVSSPRVTNVTSRMCRQSHGR